MSLTLPRALKRVLTLAALTLTLGLAQGSRNTAEAIDFSCLWTCTTEVGVIVVEDGTVFTFRNCSTEYAGDVKITTCIYVA